MSGIIDRQASIITAIGVALADEHSTIYGKFGKVTDNALDTSYSSTDFPLLIVDVYGTTNLVAAGGDRVQIEYTFSVMTFDVIGKHSDSVAITRATADTSHQLILNWLQTNYDLRCGGTDEYVETVIGTEKAVGVRTSVTNCP